MEDPAGHQPPAADPAGHCPHCGTPLPDSFDEAYPSQCPGCGADLSAAGERMAASVGSLDYALTGTPHDRQGDFAEELDGLRIRQVATLRRGTARARSYLLIGVIVSTVACVKLVLMTIDHVRAGGWGLTPLGYLLFVAVLLMLASYFGRRAMELHRELQVPAPLPPVQGEPDFSTLSDGSQHWKNLNEIR